MGLEQLQCLDKERNARNPANPVPDDILVCSEPEIINLYLFTVKRKE